MYALDSNISFFDVLMYSMYKKVVELLKKIEYDLFSELKHNFWNKRNFKKRL